MAIKITPREDQLEQLAVLRDLQAQEIQNLVHALSAAEKSLLKPSELNDKVMLVLNRPESEVRAVTNQIIFLYTLCRQRNLTVDELLNGLQAGIRASDHGWSEEELNRWQDVVPFIKELLSIDAIKTVVKALELSYDYANLFQSAKILTDIRPIFDEELNISAGVISFTLRIFYDDLEGSKNISIALDEKDVDLLSKACNRAIKKAESSRNFMIKSGIKKTFICGEGNDTK